MKLAKQIATTGAALVLLGACTDSPLPTDTMSGTSRVSLTGSSVLDAYPGVQLSRPRVDLSDLAAPTNVLTEDDLVTPEAATDIGPGSALLITIPNEGRFGCSANFVYNSATGPRRYLGAAGHCFLPGDRTSTHGAGADYDASGVTVQVCIANCAKGFRSGIVAEGTWLTLGKVRYARQNREDGEAVGYDFGVVEIPRKIEGVVRHSLPVWGGPTGMHTLAFGDFGCHYGNGIVTGELYPTKARVGVGGASDDVAWAGDFVAAFGDSGSGMVMCTPSGTTFVGQGAVGILTHLGVWVDTNGEHGVVLGTNIDQAIRMATEARLSLTLALQ